MSAEQQVSKAQQVLMSSSPPCATRLTTHALSREKSDYKYTFSVTIDRRCEMSRALLRRASLARRTGDENQRELYRKCTRHATLTENDNFRSNPRSHMVRARRNTREAANVAERNIDSRKITHSILSSRAYFAGSTATRLFRLVGSQSFATDRLESHGAGSNLAANAN